VKIGEIEDYFELTSSCDFDLKWVKANKYLSVFQGLLAKEDCKLKATEGNKWLNLRFKQGYAVIEYSLTYDYVDGRYMLLYAKCVENIHVEFEVLGFGNYEDVTYYVVKEVQKLLGKRLV
jgi:hypothetical protein